VSAFASVILSIRLGKPPYILTWVFIIGSCIHLKMDVHNNFFLNYVCVYILREMFTVGSCIHFKMAVYNNVRVYILRWMFLIWSCIHPKMDVYNMFLYTS